MAEVQWALLWKRGPKEATIVACKGEDIAAAENDDGCWVPEMSVLSVPPGMSLYVGEDTGGEERYRFVGVIRPLTDDEWQRLREGKAPWDG